MDHYLILARSITYAQRMQKTLGQTGIRSRIFRAPRDITESGCAYAVQVAASDIYNAIHLLERGMMGPLQIFSYQDGKYREVGR